MKLFPPVIRAAKALMRAGKSRRAAARLMGLSESGLRAAVARSKRGRKQVTLGRPRALSQKQRKAVLKMANSEFRAGRTVTAAQLIRKLKLPCCENTVCSELKMLGKKHLNRAIKGQHTAAQRKSDTSF